MNLFNTGNIVVVSMNWHRTDL